MIASSAGPPVLTQTCVPPPVTAICEHDCVLSVEQPVCLCQCNGGFTHNIGWVAVKGLVGGRIARIGRDRSMCGVSVSSLGLSVS